MQVNIIIFYSINKALRGGALYVNKPVDLLNK